MKKSWIFGNTEVKRPLKDIDELLETPKIERDLGGAMERDVEMMVSVNSILASRSRFKKVLDHKE